MDAARLVRDAREEVGLSVRALAQAAGVAASTVHRIEQGELQPTLGVLAGITEAAGRRLTVDSSPDHAVSLVGLARSVRDDVATGDRAWPVRKAAELVARFRSCEPARQCRMISARPPPTGDARWDAFLAALAEWLAVRADLPVPQWARGTDRYLDDAWWVSPMTSMRAWEYSGSPMAFKLHGVYLHRDSLVNV